MKTIIPTATLFALTACASQLTWVPTERSTLSLRMADAKCRFEAEKGSPTHTSGAGIIATAGEQATLFNLCMRAEGFALAAKDKRNTAFKGSNAYKMADGAAIQVGRGKLCGIATAQELEEKILKALPLYAADKNAETLALEHFKRKAIDTENTPLPISCDKVQKDNETYLINMMRVGF